MASHNRVNMGIKTTLSFGEKVKLHEVLKEYITMAEDGIHAVYVDNHTDRTVAEIASAKHRINVSSHNVANIRKELYGNLVVGGSKIRRDGLAGRITFLEEQLKNVYESLGMAWVEPVAVGEN